jgi:hypothetical protein
MPDELQGDNRDYGTLKEPSLTCPVSVLDAGAGRYYESETSIKPLTSNN